MPKKPRKNASDAKPYPDFPLTPHKSGRWRKIHKGKAFWFGPLDDPDGALAYFNHAWPYIKAGKRIPPMPGEQRQTHPDDDANRLRDTLNAFIDSRAEKAHNGELSKRMLADYARTAELICEAVGGWRDVDDLTADDFDAIRAHFGRGRALQTVANHVTRTRSMFKWIEQKRYASHATDFGPDFVKPRQERIDHQKAQRPDKGFAATEIRKLIENASTPMKAMILLGINAAYGNTDVALLDSHQLQLRDGLLMVPRSKTAKPRRAALWPETIEAIREALAAEDARRERGGKIDDDAVDAVFVTRYGRRWRRFDLTDELKPRGTDAVGLAFRRLMNDLKLPAGRGFYGLRHSFRRAADDFADRPAVDFVMGHQPKDIRGHYVPAESIDAKRTRAVADHVHAWLYPPKKKGKTNAKRKTK